MKRGPSFVVKWVLLTLVMLAVVAGCVLASWWQFERTSQEVALDEAAVAERVKLSELVTAGGSMPVQGIGRKVSVEGRWQPQHGVLIRDRLSDAGVSGYWAVSSIVDSDGTVVPVLLGWVPDVDFDFPSGPVGIEGRLQTEENFYPDAVVSPDSPLVTITHAGLLTHWADNVAAADLSPGFVAMTGALPPVADLELVRPVIGEGPGAGFPLQNIGYGLQWIVFAVLAFVIWGWWLRQDLRSEARPVVFADERDGVNVGG